MRAGSALTVVVVLTSRALAGCVGTGAGTRTDSTGNLHRWAQMVVIVVENEGAEPGEAND